MKISLGTLFLYLCCLCAQAHAAPSQDLFDRFRNPPPSARPGVYWYFMDGNLSREGITRDLESMKAAGLGHVLFLEVNVGVPRGPVPFFSDTWQGLFAHAVSEANRLGIELTLGLGPGWTGSGGPWVKPEQSMQHLVASQTQVSGPSHFLGKLPLVPPHRPFFGPVPKTLQEQWGTFYRDVAVLAFPTPENPATIPDIEEKSLVYRPPYSSQPNVKPRIDAPADFPTDPAGSTIPPESVIDLTSRMQSDGMIDWTVPPGNWTIARFISRNNGASTRPAPEPGIGFECDKFDAAALDAHLDAYVSKLQRNTGPVHPGSGWTLLHMDSWEMGAQNWTPQFREEFRKRRGYDPEPFYPVYLGLVVRSREQSERFLWDLRQTGQELVLEDHAKHLKDRAHTLGFSVSIEPYDMNPVNDFDLGAVADIPMAEFWSVGFNTEYSCHEAASIGHVLGRPVVAAESFTGGPEEAWRLYPGALKNQGDWALATGINRFTYHTFAHKPDERRPGMVMGPYGVHWDRGQTWWPMAAAYHLYISRCQQLLREGRTVADILYLLPEGAPNVFCPPASAFSGPANRQDRRGYNFDGCSAQTLLQLATSRNGKIVFPSGASYELLVLPDCETMTPGLLRKIQSLTRAGATVVGNPSRKSPSLAAYPKCDAEVADRAADLWGSLQPPVTLREKRFGAGKVFSGEPLRQHATARPGGARDLYPDYELTAAILARKKVPEDLSTKGPPIRYTHRTTAKDEVYFVSNPYATKIETTVSFRAGEGPPELWSPMDGSRRALPEFVRNENRARVPLQFEPFESYFIVIPKKRARGPSASGSTNNFPRFVQIQEMRQPWRVRFDPEMGAPKTADFETLEDWSKRAEPGIKYYSGIGTYAATFDVSSNALAGPGAIFLDLGRVEVMARVRVNGKDCGVIWTQPWRVNITGALKAKGNTIEIQVANLWPNRMIGDAALGGKKFAQTTYRPWKAGDPLLPSGLLGPVRLLKEQ